MTRRLVYIGNFKPAHSTENEVASCFRALGWQVSTAQEDALRRPTELAGVADDAMWADLVLYTRTWGFDGALDLWRSCEAAGVPTAALHLDLFYGLRSPKGHNNLPRESMPTADPMFRTRYVFTPDGDHDSEWKRDDVNHWWLPPAIGCDSCWDGRPDRRWRGIDVAFVGSRDYHPEWPHRPRLIDELARRFGSRFAHVSGETMPDGHALRGKALHDLYASVPVIVGDSCWVGRKPPDTRYWSDRVYEVWGRGGFLVMPFIEALDRHLRASGYPAWEPWDDFDAIEATVRMWIDDHSRREGIRRPMVERVRAEHTWAQRVEEMLELMGLEP